MKNNSILTNIIKALGKNNDAAYAVVAVATAKGFFRPMFTMMDKHQDHETKKYTAMREGLTECIAIPCYIGVSALAKKAIAPRLYKGAEAIETAGKTLSFVGVCAAALIIIPGMCSLVMNPIMDFLNKKTPTNNQNQNNLDIKEQPIVVSSEIIKSDVQKPLVAQQSLSAPYAAFKFSSGLKVGGGV